MFRFPVMELFLIVIAVLLALAGLAGCILPGLPGPPLNYAALLILHWQYHQFSMLFLIGWGVVTALMVVLDYYAPVWISKKLGASKAGITGSWIGLLVGIIFTPIGMVAGMIVGAIIGDLIAGKQLHEAVRAGLGNAAGTLLSTGLKLIVSLVLTFYLVKGIVLAYS